MAQLLAHMPTLTRVARVEKERAESFIDDTERIVLVGEAAYPKGVRTPHTTAPLYCWISDALTRIYIFTS